MISLDRDAHPGLDSLQRTIMAFDRRVASQAGNIATAMETLQSLVDQPLTPEDRRRLKDDVIDVGKQLWILLYKDLAEKIGCAGPTGGQPTISMPDGRVVSATDVLQEALNYVADEEIRIAILAAIARYAHSDIVIRIAEMGMILKSKSSGMMGEEIRDSILAVVRVPATLMGLREAFKTHFESPLYADSPMAVHKQDCQTLFAYVVRFLPTFIDLHQSRTLNNTRHLLPTSIFVSSTLFRASHWHLMHADRETTMFSSLLAHEDEREVCERRWKQRVIDVVQDTVQLSLNDDSLFSKQTTWKPALFDRLRDELAGTGRQRDHEGNLILRDSYGRVPVGFPPEWANSSYARMCAVLGTVNAVSMVAPLVLEQRFANRYSLVGALVPAINELGIAYMTSYLTCIEIVAFCVIRLIVAVAEPPMPGDVREQTVRCLRYLLGVYDSQAQEPDVRTIFDSCTFWPVNDLPEVVVEWKGTSVASGHALCLAFLHAVRRNSVANFCRSLVVQLQH